MILKKNKVSNLIWIIYSIFALVFSAFVFTKAAQNLGFDSGYGLVAVPILLGISVGIVYLLSFIGTKINKKITIKPLVANIVIYGVALCLLGAGIWLRIHEFGMAQYELGEYYRNSFITDSPMYMTLHGASQFYYYFLRNIFMLFGNHFEAAVVFQIVCQICAIVVLFFGIKRMMGNIPALSLLAFGMLAPISISQCMKLGPSCLYLLFVAVDILVISYSVPFRKSSYVFAGIAGALTGIIGYMDLTSVIFVFVAIAFLLVSDAGAEAEKNEADKLKTSSNNRKTNKKSAKGKINFSVKLINLSPEKVSVLQDKIIALILFFGAWLFLLFVCVVVDLAVTGYSFSYVVRTQLSLYKPGNFSLYSLYGGVDEISGIILSVLMLTGIMAGFKRKRTDQGTMVFIIAAVLCVVAGFSMLETDMNCYFYIFIVFSLLGGEAIKGIIDSCLNNVFVIRTAEAEQAIKLEEEKKKDKSGTVHKIEDGEMLDNPLPVPERKQRKKMEYDYFVPEDAEYDI